MFDRLFPCPRAAARHRDGPASEERLAFLTHLASQGVTDWTLRVVAFHILPAAHFLRLAERPRQAVSAAEVERLAARWARRPRRTSQPSNPVWAHKRFAWHVTQWLRFLGRWQGPSAPPCPAAEHVAAFAESLRRERNLSPVTIRNYCWAVRRFLRLLLPAGGSLRRIGNARVDEAVLAMVGREGYARRTVRNFADCLRAFFRYAEGRGWCRKGLADAIKGPRTFAFQSLPAGPAWADVGRLLALTEGDRAVDVRDRAILLLLAVYALRAGEVNRLRLDDFDWERERLSVAGSKTRRTRTYPLTRPVGDAVLRYLKEVWPRSAHREVFLTLRAPFRPLRQALGPIVAKRLRSLGLSLPHYGPHALRHACAAHLLACGLSLKEIGDHLGHTDYEQATRVYAKVDLAGLRQVADLDLGGLL